MSPKKRKRKGFIASKISNLVKEQDLSKKDQVEVLVLALKQLGIYERFSNERKP